MNEMYEMSLSIHEVGVLLLLLIFVGSLWQLKQADDLMKYLHKMRIQGPMIMMTMFAPIFTGMVMMAAKHLDFSVANIVMIVLSIVLIVLERKRSKPLKYASITEEGMFDKYKKNASIILVIEMALIIMISIGMYL